MTHPQSLHQALQHFFHADDDFGRLLDQHQQIRETTFLWKELIRHHGEAILSQLPCVMAEQEYTAEVERLCEAAFAVDLCHDEALFVSEVEATLWQEVTATMQRFVDIRLDINFRLTKAAPVADAATLAAVTQALHSGCPRGFGDEPDQVEDAKNTPLRSSGYEPGQAGDTESTRFLNFCDGPLQADVVERILLLGFCDEPNLKDEVTCTSFLGFCHEPQDDATESTPFF